MTPKVGKPETSWWDVESGLQIKSSLIVTNEMGDIAMDAYALDYKDVDGILVPFTAKQVLMGVQEMFIKIETMEWDKEFPEGIFDIPADVQALVDAK